MSFLCAIRDKLSANFEFITRICNSRIYQKRELHNIDINILTRLLFFIICYYWSRPPGKQYRPRPPIGVHEIDQNRSAKPVPPPMVQPPPPHQRCTSGCKQLSHATYFSNMKRRQKTTRVLACITFESITSREHICFVFGNK